MSGPLLTPSGQRFSGFAARYDHFRPAPPGEILRILPALAKTGKPRLVADLGCGAGSSTHPWAEVAETVIGIDPAPDMVEFARENTDKLNVSFRVGEGERTGLDADSVDILTCSSSIHWMEPGPTFQEIRRVLRPGGVFAAYGPKIPFLPIKAWEMGAALNDFLAYARRTDSTHSPEPPPPQWKWSEILEHCNTMAGFRYTDELAFDATIEWNADQCCSWLTTFSYVNNLLQQGHAEIQGRLDQFKARFVECLGTEKTPLLLSYRLILGIK